ncbi:asparagine synthase (glutamine-hydrolyzing) [Paucidesulfovibrio longus]|uniref:asparagine synthase (glutamine-hydrolyzing) n=1 Tax=Paucidesulfovibrio longus TaxID=889 RepID=UPI0003B39506|nr:asparagine synthase (glutamine-hydrolyzing) [Paucidesulfovibrio longus]
MCGIFGVVGRLDADTAGRCLDRLAHRGPDGRGLEILDGCVLGHRRLAILDASEAGKQPMTSACGRWTLSFNGEIYNFLELRADLEARGRTFHSGSDTEVLLEALVLWGPDCLSRCNGMWALALWDRREHRLLLARDRFGKKPLFWAETRHGLAFASEMKALFPLLDRLEANPELAGSSRRIMSYEGTPDCLVRGINRFPAGHLAWTRGEAPRPVRWWNTLDHLETPPARFEEQAERFRELFLDACRLRLRSDVPLGTSLSGGLDSGAVVCALAHLERQGGRAPRQGRDWRNAFCAAFPGTPLDESAPATLAARHAGLDAHLVETDPASVPDTLYRDLWLLEEQHLTLPSPFMRVYAAQRRSGVRVSLDGHGADEMFAGYGFDYLHAMHDAPPWRWPDVAAAYRAGLPRGPQFPRPSTLRLVRDHLKNRLRREPAPMFGGPDADHPAWQGMGRLNRLLHHGFHRTILPTLLRNYDRYSMACGVEVRMPFMDHRIVTFAFSLPWTSKLRGGFSKAVVRAGMAPLMPREIAWARTKIGFNAPALEWMRGPLRPFFEDALHSRAFRESGLADQPLAAGRFQALVDAERPTFDQAQACWTAFLPFFWEEAVLRGKGEPKGGTCASSC